MKWQQAFLVTTDGRMLLCIPGLHVCGPGVLDADLRMDLGAASAFVMYYETDA